MCEYHWLDTIGYYRPNALNGGSSEIAMIGYGRTSDRTSDRIPHNGRRLNCLQNDKKSRNQMKDQRKIRSIWVGIMIVRMGQCQ